MNFGKYSYAFGREIILDRRSSAFHNITVADSGFLRMLRFDRSNVQGVVHLKNPHIIVLDYMRLQLLYLLWKIEPERILIIGLGAGILPKIFHYLSAKTWIDTVEIDSEIIDLAQNYFDLRENSSIRIYKEDGRQFVERQPSNQYDAVIIDAFTVNGRIPHALRTLECVGEYLRILKSTGVVLANFHYEQESRYRQTYGRSLFKHIYRGVTKDNFILIGLNSQARIFGRNELRRQAVILQESKPLPEMNWIELTKYIHNGNDDKWNISANIFTDKIYEYS